jgi:small subunit ribosomal protein S11
VGLSTLNQHLITQSLILRISKEIHYFGLLPEGVGLKELKKSTPFAAQSAAEKVATIAYEQGMRQAEVVVSGPGSGRETAIRALQGCGLQVLVIKDITPVPHNGCRPPKKRRV